MNDTKHDAAWHGAEAPVMWEPVPIPYDPRERRPEPRWVKPLVLAVALVLAGLAMALVFRTADARAARAADCRAALAAAQTISANSRAHWDETQALVNAGADSQYTDRRADAERVVAKITATIEARERLLEAAQTRFNTALKGCNA